ncbi:MAG: cysteine dioxygenase family protein [Proteobacteria bacterium]|nr:cysteine dioxygenase family protein [Pseudomonadota bacterium]
MLGVGSEAVLSHPVASGPSAGQGAGLRPPALSVMLAEIDRAVRAGGPVQPERIAQVLAAHLADPALLDGVLCPCDKSRYTRHLLGEGKGYCVLAIAWAPGQMSPVHAHKTWCAFGVHRGWLVESYFTADASGQASPVGCRPRGPADVGHASAGPEAIHRLANVGVADALSVHVYGAAYDRLGADVNHVFAA